MGSGTRAQEIHARRMRKKKLTKLRERYTNAKNAIEKEAVLGKLGHLVPWMHKEEFLKTMK